MKGQEGRPLKLAEVAINKAHAVFNRILAEENSGNNVHENCVWKHGLVVEAAVTSTSVTVDGSLIVPVITKLGIVKLPSWIKLLNPRMYFIAFDNDPYLKTSTSPQS